MNLGEMEEELATIIRSRSDRKFMNRWINNAILEVATDYNLPPLALVDPVSLGVDTSKWLWGLPDSFHKRLFKCRHINPTSGESHHVHVCNHINELNSKNHATIGEHVREVAVAMQGGSAQGDNYYLGIHPLATETLSLWYYQKPAVLIKPADVSDCIPPGYERRVIYPKVIILNYNFIVDQITDFDFKPMQYWVNELKKGLNGAPGEGIGLLNFYALNYNKPRRHGGRDPIGPSRRYFRGYF